MRRKLDDERGREGSFEPQRMRRSSIDEKRIVRMLLSNVTTPYGTLIIVQVKREVLKCNDIISSFRIEIQAKHFHLLRIGEWVP